MPDNRPPDVVVISGTIGAGKSTVSEALSDLVGENFPVAWIDLDALSQFSAPPANDPYNDELALANLAAIWPNYARLDAQKAIIARVIATPDHRARFAEALQTDRVTIVRLTASHETRHARITRREHDEHWRQKFLIRTDVLDEELATAGLEDFTVANDDRTPAETAREIIAGLGWA